MSKRGSSEAEAARVPRQTTEREPAVEAPVVEGPGAVAVMQRTMGNRAAATLLATGQAKLEVGPVHDPYEREADEIAEQVVAALGSRPADDAADGIAPQPVVQRVRRAQRREVDGAAGGGDDGGAIGAEGGPVGAAVEQQITAARGGGSGLPDAMRTSMEQAFGSSFADVKVHTGSGADQLNDAISAKAFTVGSDIFFRGGLPANDAAGQQLVAHELTHVVQQRGGQSGAQRVQRNPFKNLFGKKKKNKNKDGGISGPTGVVDKTGESLLSIVRSADAQTRAFMARDPRFIAKVDACEPEVRAQIMSLLEAAVPSSVPTPTVSVSETESSESSSEDSTPEVDPSIALAAEKAAQEKAEAEQRAKAEEEARAQEEERARQEAEAKAKREEEERQAAAAKAEEERQAAEKAKAEQEAAEKAKREEEERQAEAERQRLLKEEEDRKAAEAKAEEERKAAEALKAKQEAEAEAERQRIAKEDAKYRTTAEVMALKLPALLKYIEDTPTWHQHSKITPDDKLLINTVHAFAQLPGVASSLSGSTVQDIQDETTSPLGGTLGAVIDDLKAYVAATAANDPIALTASPNIRDARKKGNALAKLMAPGAFPRWVLKTALNQQIFDYLVSTNRIQAVVDYYALTPKPIFQAHDGLDFVAWATAMSEGWNPADFKTGELQARIRNPHRFERAALEQLRANFAGGNSAKKPLTIVLHAAVDHNSAFHRDPLLTAVITNTNTFTLLIEGGETLADYQSQIGGLATTYGVNGKIDQVMFAGHGNAQLIQMAGTVFDNGGEIGERNDMINVGGDTSKADALFDEILANMSDDAEALLDPSAAKYRRILFNACLTNSNVVDTNLDEDDTLARQQITTYIEQHASLATYLANKAKKDGFGGVKSLGANASIGQVKLAKPSGELDLVSTADPFVTAAKLEYAEKGVEPLGVLRAALQAWAEDPTAALEAMARRVAAATKAWDDVIITTIYQNIINFAQGSPGRNNARVIKEWADIAGAVSEMKSDAHCKVSELYGFMNNGFETMVFELLPPLNQSNEWNASKTLQLVMLQVWIRCHPQQANLDFFLGVLEQFDAKSASVAKGKYVDMEFLKAFNLVGPLLAGGATKGKTILALIALLDGGAPAPAKTYFTSKLEAGAPELPELPEVAEVPPIPESNGPRPKIDAVPLVKGRPKVDEIPNRRPAAAKIPDLEALPELPEVLPVSGPLQPGEARPTVVAPGRKGRPKRDRVPKVPAVKPYIPDAMNFETLVAKRATEDEILAKAK